MNIDKFKFANQTIEIKFKNTILIFITLKHGFNNNKQYLFTLH